MILREIKNNKGETLVEIIIGVLLLAIASVCLVSGFVTTANIVQRADLMKNSSAAVSSSLELKNTQAEKNTYDVNFDNLDVETPSVLQRNVKISGRKSNGTHFNIAVSGDLITAKQGEKTGITYREFVPGIYDVNTP